MVPPRKFGLIPELLFCYKPLPASCQTSPWSFSDSESGTRGLSCVALATGCGSLLVGGTYERLDAPKHFFASSFSFFAVGRELSSLITAACCERWPFPGGGVVTKRRSKGEVAAKATRLSCHYEQIIASAARHEHYIPFASHYRRNGTRHIVNQALVKFLKVYSFDERHCNNKSTFLGFCLWISKQDKHTFLHCVLLLSCYPHSWIAWNNL